MAVLGLAWALLAPFVALALLALAWRLARQWHPQGNQRAQFVACLVAPVLVLAGIYLSDRVNFHSICESLVNARIVERQHVDGFFLDDSTANSFGMRYLQEEGFDWIEARSIMTRDRYTRYRRSGTTITSEEIDSSSASVRVATQYIDQPRGVSIQSTLITERASGRELARAERARFDGGRARWLLGFWGAADCTNPASARGQRAFQDWYHLARNTLRSESLPAAPPR